MKFPHILTGSLLALTLSHAGLEAIAVPSTPVLPSSVKAAPAPLAPKDEAFFQSLIQQAQQQGINTKSVGEVMEFFSMKLLDRPYVAGMLDQSEQENLVLSLTQFDCVLFVESVMALAHSLRVNASSPVATSQPFANRVEDLRYRDGVRTNYCDRLHYFSEWLDNNQKKQYLANITPQLQGIPLNTKLQFMSRHRSSYRQLKNPELYNCIVEREDQLASLPMHYIPTANISAIESQLQPGDIIAVATSVPYLDVTHTGLIYRGTKGQKGLIHASPGGSVRLASDLTRYVSRVDSAIGIMVARPTENAQ